VCPWASLQQVVSSESALSGTSLPQWDVYISGTHQRRTIIARLQCPQSLPIYSGVRRASLRSLCLCPIPVSHVVFVVCRHIITRSEQKDTENTTISERHGCRTYTLCCAEVRRNCVDICVELQCNLLEIYIRIVPHALPTKERRLYILLCCISNTFLQHLPSSHSSHSLSSSRTFHFNIIPQSM
jgi:hypothetical protein